MYFLKQLLNFFLKRIALLSTFKAFSLLAIIPSLKAQYVKKSTDLHSVIYKYNFSNNAMLNITYKAKILYQKVKTIISKYIVNKSGKVLRH